jgi:hypothetical protein
VDYTVVLEWNAFFISFMWLYSFYEEWKRIKLVLIGPAPSQMAIQMI